LRTNSPWRVPQHARIPNRRPATTLEPPSAQSPFAAAWRYHAAGDLPHLLGGHYPAFFAPTGSCAKPMPSSRLGSRPRTRGLRRLLPAPAGHRPFPTFSLPIFPCVSGPILRLPLECIRPLLPLGHWPPPANERVGAFCVIPTATSVGNIFRSCSHSFMFRPVSLLAILVAPTRSLAGSGSHGFYVRPSHGWLPAPCCGYANRPKPGNWR
jgi:hypothetical protein